MPAYSGLYNGVFGENYAPISQPRPPLSGLLRAVLQRRGSYGYVRGFGRKSPTVVAAIDMDRNDMIVRGGWDYATRLDDAANRVTITNVGGDVNTIGTEPMPATATTQDMVKVADTVLNRQYVRDEALTGVTATAMPERRTP